MYAIMVLSVNQLGEIRGDNDANLTYEGDNNVLLIQTSNYLLAALQSVRRGEQRYCYSRKY